MKNRTKKIISLSLISSMLLLFSGCSKEEKIQKIYNEKTQMFEYVGEQNIEKLYVLEVIDNTNKKHIFLVQEIKQELLDPGFKQYKDIRTGQEIRDISGVVKIKNIIPLKAFLYDKIETKEKYNGNELNDIYDKYIINKKNDSKKLEIKK